MATATVCPIFFGLSRSTRCGCCSYQVSSISVLRVTCYDHFSAFLFFRMAVSMATAAILKKSQGFIKFDQGISEKSSRQKCVEEE